MKARYRYRFYPTDQQRQSLAQVFGCVRVVWNDALAVCKQSEKLPSNNDLQKLVITQAKKTEERGWLATVSNIPLQQSVADLGVAYKNFFNSLKGKRKGKRVGAPKFKKKTGRQSARFRIGGFSIKGNLQAKSALNAATNGVSLIYLYVQFFASIVDRSTIEMKMQRKI
jgi:putative transposase